MKAQQKPSLWAALLLAIMVACRTDDLSTPTGPTFDNTAYRPIYVSQNQLSNSVEVATPQPLKEAGKIYVKDNFLLIVDVGRGIHIVDNQDPTNPKKLSFLKILATNDIAIKGNWLYADNATDLVVFDVSNPTAPKLAKRIANVIPINYYPPNRQIYFDCVDESQGIVAGWEKYSTNTRPRCYR